MRRLVFWMTGSNYRMKKKNLKKDPSITITFPSFNPRISLVTIGYQIKARQLWFSRVIQIQLGKKIRVSRLLTKHQYLECHITWNRSPLFCNSSLQRFWICSWWDSNIKTCFCFRWLQIHDKSLEEKEADRSMYSITREFVNSQCSHLW